MKKLKQFIIFLFAFLILDFGLSKTQIPYNSKGYLIGFKNFIKKAKETKGQKRIILIGGSSLGWGVSAKDLTANTGVLTLNAGIHAGIKYRNHFRNIKDLIDKDKDLLVFSPEYGMDFRNIIFHRSREFCEIALYSRGSYPFDCIGYSLNKVFKIIGLVNKIDKEYNRYGFNEYGDYELRKYSDNKKNNFNELCENLNPLEVKNKYLPYLKNLKNKNYKILYIPNFIPKSACNKSYLLKEINEILTNNFGVKGINNKLMFDDKYFYDTHYHPNDEGRKIKTQIFETHLKNYFMNQKKN